MNHHDIYEDKKNLCPTILKFLEESDEDNDDESKNETIQEIIKVQQIEGDAEEMRQFLEIVNSIGEHHHRDQHFNEKIILFLIKKDIITISDEIYLEIVKKVENNRN